LQDDLRTKKKELDDLKERVAAQGPVSPQTIAKGLEMFAAGSQQTPKSVVRHTREMLVDFLDMERRTEASSKRNGSSRVLPRGFFAEQTVDGYHTGYARLVSNQLEQLESRKISVGDLLKLSRNVKSVEDINSLADGLKRLEDSLP
jgi:hypothetical protein